jgi:hypothetical protein
MHIHKPKALHGWREFLGEIGVIVCGVLIAIALDQTVEALHHRGEAKEMIGKLREESIENRRVIDYDLSQCRIQQAATGKDIAAVSAALRSGRLPAPPEDLPPEVNLQPGDAAWMTIRDSALLPIMPKLTIGNYWKIDYTNQAVSLRFHEASVARSQAQSLVETARQRPMDQALANDLLLRLNEYRTDENTYCGLLAAFREMNEAGLTGKAIDLDMGNELNRAARNAEQVH